MKRLVTLAVAAGLMVSLTACKDNQDKKDQENAQRQQSTYAAGQPVPNFDWSLERHLTIQSYNLRNQKVSTHAVWRGMTSVIEGDCPSMGFTLPYDTSLTNPLQRVTGSHGAVAIEQAEPNGIFLSKNSEATWVFCINDYGSIDPVLVETKVTTYPYAVHVDYQTNRVTKSGKASVNISKE